MSRAYRQHFKVEPTDSIKEGEIEYIFDPDTGAVSYKGYAKAVIFWISKTLTFDDKDHLPPEHLLSSRYREKGAELKIGDFKLTVTNVLPDGWALADLEIKFAKGTASLDVSGEFVRIHELNAFGSFLGANLALKLKEV